MEVLEIVAPFLKVEQRAMVIGTASYERIHRNPIHGTHSDDEEGQESHGMALIVICSRYILSPIFTNRYNSRREHTRFAEGDYKSVEDNVSCSVLDKFHRGA